MNNTFQQLKIPIKSPNFNSLSEYESLLFQESQSNSKSFPTPKVSQNEKKKSIFISFQVKTYI